jgi:ribosome assembly protein SQT1
MNVLAGHAGAVQCGHFFSEGRRIVSGGEDGTVRFWDPKTVSVTGMLHGTVRLSVASLRSCLTVGAQAAASMTGP